jgi:pSer/pThr/pTyr-binding forkhead associated (FHA) protein
VLTKDADEVVVRDLGSTNGTWINGGRVHCGRLKPGDEVSIAYNRYRLEEARGYEQSVPILGDRPEA